MKAHLVYWNGYWWCSRMGTTGRGRTPKEAWDDMWDIYWYTLVGRNQLTYKAPIRA